MFEKIKNDRHRLDVIRNGIDTEFWKIIKEEIGEILKTENERLVSLLKSDKQKEANNTAIVIEVLSKLKESPEKFIRSYDSFFDNFSILVCDKCGTVYKRSKEIKDAFIEKLTSRFSEKG